METMKLLNYLVDRVIQQFCNGCNKAERRCKVAKCTSKNLIFWQQTKKLQQQPRNRSPPNGHLCEVAFEWRNLGWTHIRLPTSAEEVKQEGTVRKHAKRRNWQERTRILRRTYFEAVARGSRRPRRSRRRSRTSCWPARRGEEEERGG